MRGGLSDSLSAPPPDKGSPSSSSNIPRDTASDVLCDGKKARGGRGGVLIIMHGRSRMIVDLRIHTTSGRSTSGFHRPGRHREHQARSVVRCSASCIKGELHPARNRLRGGLSCVRMTAWSELICLSVMNRAVRPDRGMACCVLKFE